MTKKEIAAEQERLANLPYSSQMETPQTPIVNGYKIIKDTPTYFRVPPTPLREELGLQLAQKTDIKKRNLKEQEKALMTEKLKYTPKYRDANLK